MEMRRAISTIVAVVALIVVVSGITFAWYSWSSNEAQQTGVVFTVIGASVEESVSSSGDENLIPVASKTSGYVTTVTLTGSSTLYVDFTLKLTTLPSALIDTSLKYELVKYTTEDVTISGASGNFSGKTQGSTITLASDQTITGTYKLYLWIDGTDHSGVTPAGMQGQTYSFNLIANVTNQAP